MKTLNKENQHEMIPIEELRIGSKIYFPECANEWEISMIKSNGVGLKRQQSNNTYSYTFTEFGNIEPIEISEKHLIELGFEKNKDFDNYYSYQATTHGRINACVISGMNNCEEKIIEIELGTNSESLFMHTRKMYLHTLQNLIIDLK